MGMDSGKCWRCRAAVMWHRGWSMQWNVDLLFFECMFSHQNIHKNSVKHSVIYIYAFFSFPASYIEIVQKTFIPETLFFWTLSIICPKHSCFSCALYSEQSSKEECLWVSYTLIEFP